MNDTTSSPNASPMFYIGSSDYYFAVPKSRPDLMNDINAAMTAIARINPRYNDEVKSSYSTQNSGSSSLNGPECSWLKANNNTITLGYITGKLPYCNEDEDGEMEGSLASLATTLHDKFGITVKTVAFDSYKMMSKALSKGSIDVALPVYRDYWFAEQTGVVQSISLGTISLTAIHTGSNLNKDLQNIACTKSSFVNKNALESLFPTATVTEYQSDGEAFDTLRKGTAHCIVAPSSRVKTLGDRYDLEDCETVELPDTCELSCWISRGKPELLGIVNKHHQCRRIALRKQLLLHVVHGPGIQHASIPLSQPCRRCSCPHRYVVGRYRPAHLGARARSNRAQKSRRCQRR